MKHLFSKSKVVGMLVAAVALMLLTPAAGALAAPAATPVGSGPAQTSAHQIHLMKSQSAYANSVKSARTIQTKSGKVTQFVYGEGQLSWHGGPVQTNPAVYLIFWGSSWDAGGGALTPDAQVVVNYFNDIGHTEFLNIAHQYYGSNGAPSNSLTLAGVVLDTTPPPTDTSCLSSPTIEDSSIQAEVSNAITAKGWALNPNALYLVYTPSGDYVNDGTGACSSQVFCAYHSDTFIGSADLPYAAMPYPVDPSCPNLGTPNGNAAGDALASFSSHEDMETITDPFFTGWLDYYGYEIGDKCAYDITFGDTIANNGDSYALQMEYSNASTQCQNWYTPETIGVVNPSTMTWYLRNSNSGGAPDFTPIQYGGAGDIPVTGDWTGQGFDSIGVFRPSTGTWYLRNSNAPGSPDITFQYGAPGDVPIVGDFCFAGVDGIGVYRPSTGTWYLRCTASAGTPDITPFSYGASTDIPIVGSWFAEGPDDVGIYRPSTQSFLLNSCDCGGVPAVTFTMGAPGDVPLMGAYYSAGTPAFWNDTPGVFAPSSAMFSLDSQLGGPSFNGYQFQFGGANWKPLIGQWINYGPGVLFEGAPTRFANHYTWSAPTTPPHSGKKYSA